jgi:hypothetical protein
MSGENGPNETMPACVESVILPPAHDIGGFEVRRAFPATQRQIFGPFIFFDQMGPGEFLTGKGLDVRLHPISSVCPRHLLVRWRDPASRQPRLRPVDRARRRQLDDIGAWYRPF